MFQIALKICWPRQFSFFIFWQLFITTTTTPRTITNVHRIDSDHTYDDMVVVDAADSVLFVGGVHLYTCSVFLLLFHV